MLLEFCFSCCDYLVSYSTVRLASELVRLHYYIIWFINQTYWGFRCYSIDFSSCNPLHTCSVGFIPPPLIFGAGIDSTCLFWSTECGDKGACLLYDNIAYRHLYVSLAIGLKVTAFILYTTTWYCLRKNYKKYIKNHEGYTTPTELFPSSLTMDNMKDGSQNPNRTKFIYNLEDHEWCENMESVL